MAAKKKPHPLPTEEEHDEDTAPKAWATPDRINELEARLAAVEDILISMGHPLRKDHAGSE